MQKPPKLGEIMTEKEKMLAGKLYIPAKSKELQEDFKKAKRLVKEYNATSVDEEGKRVEILSELLGKFDKSSHIEPPFYCDYGCHMGMSRFPPFLEQCFVGQQTRCPGGKHGVNQYQCFPFEVAARNIFDLYVECSVLAVFAECRDEGTLCIVEETQEAVVKRYSGPENSRDNQFFLRQHDLGLAQRGFDSRVIVCKRFADLVCHDLAATFEVCPEAQRIALDVDIAHLGDEAIEDRVLFIEYVQHRLDVVCLI